MLGTPFATHRIFWARSQSTFISSLQSHHRSRTRRRVPTEPLLRREGSPGPGNVPVLFASAKAIRCTSSTVMDQKPCVPAEHPRNKQNGEGQFFLGMVTYALQKCLEIDASTQKPLESSRFGFFCCYYSYYHPFFYCFYCFFFGWEQDTKIQNEENNSTCKLPQKNTAFLVTNSPFSWDSVVNPIEINRELVHLSTPPLLKYFYASEATIHSTQPQPYSKPQRDSDSSPHTAGTESCLRQTVAALHLTCHPS